MISSKYLFPELEPQLVYTVYKSMIFHRWLTQQGDNLPQGTSSAATGILSNSTPNTWDVQIQDAFLVTSRVNK